MNSQIESDYRAAVQDASKLKEDAAAMAKDMNSGVTESVQLSLGRIEGKVAEIWNNISRAGSQSYEAVEKNVEARPLAAVLAAFVAGAALAWIFDRQR